MCFLIGILKLKRIVFEMFTVLTGLLAVARNSEALKPPSLLSQQNKKQWDQTLHWTGLQERSFATQLQTTVRAPFGPNPQQKNINDMSLLRRPQYQESYQRNIFNNQPTGTEDWRVSNDFNSSLNQYSCFHMTEATNDQLLNYHFKRSNERKGK